MDCCCCLEELFSFLPWIHWVWTQLPCEEAQFEAYSYKGVWDKRGHGTRGQKKRLSLKGYWQFLDACVVWVARQKILTWSMDGLRTLHYWKWAEPRDQNPCRISTIKSSHLLEEMQKMCSWILLQCPYYLKRRQVKALFVSFLCTLEVVCPMIISVDGTVKAEATEYSISHKCRLSWCQENLPSPALFH